MGFLVLQGGSEFGGRMRDSDLKAMDLAGGKTAPIRIIPAAAAPDNNHVNAGNNGRTWFESLGAVDVGVVPLIDHASADDQGLAADLGRAGMIYMLGGFPGHLAASLTASSAWDAIKATLDDGAVLAGSSAGAMVLCRYMFDPLKRSVVPGLGLIPDVCVIPHHNRSGDQWTAALRKDLPTQTLIGIDEQTGMISDGRELPCRWTVYGRGEVTLHLRQGIEKHKHGQSFDL